MAAGNLPAGRGPITVLHKKPKHTKTRGGIDLVWRKDADALQAHDRQVLETGKTSYIHEHVRQSVHGDASLNVCKWVGDLDGRRCCFGICFIIDE